MAEQAQIQSRLTPVRHANTGNPSASTDSMFPPASSRPGAHTIISRLSLLGFVSMTTGKSSRTPTCFQSWQPPEMGQVEQVDRRVKRRQRGPGDRANLQTIRRCLGSRLAEELSQRTTTIVWDPTFLCEVPSSLSGVCSLKGRRSTEHGWQSICTSVAGTETAACHQPTDRETGGGALISAACLLALNHDGTVSRGMRSGIVESRQFVEN